MRTVKAASGLTKVDKMERAVATRVPGMTCPHCHLPIAASKGSDGKNVYVCCGQTMRLQRM